MLLVFAATGINTGALIVLSRASAVEYADYTTPELQELFPRNGFTDFSVQWYRTTGSMLTDALIKSALLPIAEFIGFSLIFQLKRFYDRRFTCNYEITRKKSVFHYI
jgi:hypothetical protein